jgi:hypothetical protein
VLERLPSVNTLEAKALLKYFTFTKKFYDALTIPNTEKAPYPIDKKISDLNECKKFFSSLQGSTTKSLQFQISTTVSDFFRLVEMAKKNGISLYKVSHLSTNVVELFFSKIRAKIRYPNLLQYGYCFERSWEENVKRCSDLPYTYPDADSFSKCYNNTHGVRFTIDDIKPRKARVLQGETERKRGHRSAKSRVL